MYPADIEELKTKLDSAEQEITKLRDENSRFRSLMLSDINGIKTIDPIYIAQKKLTWQDLPIETILTFLDVFQTHASIFQEIATEKKGKNAIKEHVANINIAKSKTVDDYRKGLEDKVASGKVISGKNPIGPKAAFIKEFGVTEEQAQIWFMMEKVQRNAMKGIMRIVGGHFDAALKMLTGQLEGMKK